MSVSLNRCPGLYARERPDVALVGLGESSEHAPALIDKIVCEAPAR